MRDQNARENDFDQETGPDAQCRERVISFTVRDAVFRFSLSIPLRILNALSSVDWDRSVGMIEGKALEYLREAAANHSLYRPGGRKLVDDLLLKYAKQCIYERFLDHQERAGNAKWEVPPSLQATMLSEGTL